MAEIVFDCPIAGLTASYAQKDGENRYIILRPASGYRMRITALDSTDIDGITEPFYAREASAPVDYDFTENPRGFAGEPAETEGQA